MAVLIGNDKPFMDRLAEVRCPQTINNITGDDKERANTGNRQHVEQHVGTPFELDLRVEFL